VCACVCVYVFVFACVCLRVSSFVYVCVWVCVGKRESAFRGDTARVNDSKISYRTTQARGVRASLFAAAAALPIVRNSACTP